MYLSVVVGVSFLMERINFFLLRGVGSIKPCDFRDACFCPDCRKRCPSGGSAWICNPYSGSKRNPFCPRVAGIDSNSEELLNALTPRRADSICAFKALECHCRRKQVATLRMHSARYKQNNDRKHETEKRRPCDVIQESARTTVCQKNTVTRMMGHSNCMLIDFHSLAPETYVASCKSGFRFREADRKLFIRLQMDCDL
jgi:hypothetical protein